MILSQCFYVAAARSQYKVELPNTDGPEGFRRVFRAHQNTLEQLPFFLISMWSFAITTSFFIAIWLIRIDDQIAGYLGLIWVVLRSIYAIAYPRKLRLAPYTISSYLFGIFMLLGSAQSIISSYFD